nr:neuroguidin [Quercus suber]
MKEGLDTVRTKVQALTSKVKASQFPTADGISYLETKHLLLLNYCQSLVYYLLRKAKGFSIEGHPAVRSLIETRLFLEKMRPIDKKLQYQIHKLTRVTTDTTEVVGTIDEGGGGVYRPPKLVPVVMEEDKISKKERNALRKEKQMLRQSRQSDFMREMMDNMEGRPEEVREIIGAESVEVSRYKAKMEKRARQEEELFTRAPMTKMEKKKEKHLKKSRNGLLGLTKSFYDEIKALPLEDDNSEQATGFGYGSGKGKLKKRKRRY